MFPFLSSNPRRAREVFAKTIVESLSDDNNLIYAGIPSDDIFHITKKYNIKTVYDDFDIIKKGKLALFFYSVHFLLKNKVDIIFERASMNPIGLFLSIMFGIKYLTDAHIVCATEVPLVRKYRNFYRLMDSLRFFKSRLIFASYQSQLDSIPIVLKKEYQNTVIIGPYVNHEKFFPSSITESKALIKVKRDYVCYAGSFDEEHKPELLISAFNLIAKEYPQVDLMLLGSGNTLKQLKKQVQYMNLSKRVIFKMRVSNDLVPSYLSGSLFCVNPTVTLRNRIIGMVGDKSIEYASCGKPQLLPNLRGIAEELSKVKGAIRVGSTLNPENLAKGMRFLLENRLIRLEMGRRSREKIEKDWNINSYKEQLINSISKI